MDAKITKKRLAGMLSYDWIKIVALSVAAIIVWMLIFTMTATRITPAQQFTVFNYYCNGALSNTDFSATYAKAFSDNVFSYEVIETNYNDLVTSGEYASTILQARVSTDEGDVIFIPNIGDEDTQTTDENGETVYESTYLETFFSGYYTSVFNLDPEAEDGYFKRMENYLNGFYGGDYENGTLDEEKVKSAFVTRIEKNKDKRFKKEAQIEQGKADEVERIKKYRDALVAFYGYLDEGLVAFTEVAATNGNGDTVRQGKYALDLCPNTDTMGGLSKQFYYMTTEDYVSDGETKSRSVRSAKNMNVMFFNMSGTEDSFEYESLLYVNYLIENCRTKTA